MNNSIRLEEALDAMYRDLEHYESMGDIAMAAEIEDAIAAFKAKYANLLYPNGR